jgi:hypothetical protein
MTDPRWFCSLCPLDAGRIDHFTLEGDSFIVAARSRYGAWVIPTFESRGDGSGNAPKRNNAPVPVNFAMS